MKEISTPSLVGKPLALAWASLAIGLILCGVDARESLLGEKPGFYEAPGVTPGQILKARGYLAEDFYVRTKDKYVLRVTRGRNPLINEGKGGLPGRVPILFIHGILESYNVFVINSFGAHPSDLSEFDLAKLKLEDANHLFGDIPSARAMPLLAMDMGHEVFIMSRRGFPGSQLLLGDPVSGNTENGTSSEQKGPISSLLKGALTDNGNILKQIPFSFDAKFWNFSLDEQAEFDIVATVDFVRLKTGVDKIATVSHSSGGAIFLMALSLNPHLNDKLAANILWSQAFSLSGGPIVNVVAPTLPIDELYTGSIPPAFVVDQLDALLGLICAPKLLASTLCEGFIDLILGFSGGLAPLKPEFINSLLYPGSSHEFAQFLQTVARGGKMCRFTKSLLDPCQPYDLSTITNKKLSFYVGKTDGLVVPADVMATLRLLHVPYRFHFIDSIFNHNGYFFRTNNSRLAVIPSLRELQILASQ